MFGKITIFLFSTILALTHADPNIGSKANFTNNVIASTQNLGGINCLVNSIFNVEDTANNFIYNIQLCKVEKTNVISQLLEYSEILNRRTNIVINADDNICKNAAYNETTDAYKQPPAHCAKAIQNGMSRVFNIIYRIFQLLIQDDLNIEDSCSEEAATTLKLNLPVFTESVQNCANVFDYDYNYDY